MNQVNESHSRVSDIWREVASLFRPPSRLPVAEAIRRYMRVPRGANTSGPWESSLTPYMIDPINTLSAREYDAVVFVGPARTGKTEGLIDGWIVYGIICDPADMLVVQMTETKAREHSERVFPGRFATVRRSASASVLPVMTTTSTIKCFLTAPS